MPIYCGKYFTTDGKCVSRKHGNLETDRSKAPGFWCVIFLVENWANFYKHFHSLGLEWI